MDCLPPPPPYPGSIITTWTNSLGGWWRVFYQDDLFSIFEHCEKAGLPVYQEMLGFVKAVSCLMKLILDTGVPADPLRIVFASVVRHRYNTIGHGVPLNVCYAINPSSLNIQMTSAEKAKMKIYHSLLMQSKIKSTALNGHLKSAAAFAKAAVDIKSSFRGAEMDPNATASWNMHCEKADEFMRRALPNRMWERPLCSIDMYVSRLVALIAFEFWTTPHDDCLLLHLFPLVVMYKACEDMQNVLPMFTTLKQDGIVKVFYEVGELGTLNGQHLYVSPGHLRAHEQPHCQLRRRGRSAHRVQLQHIAHRIHPYLHCVCIYPPAQLSDGIDLRVGARGCVRNPVPTHLVLELGGLQRDGHLLPDSPSAVQFSLDCSSSRLRVSHTHSRRWVKPLPTRDLLNECLVLERVASIDARHTALVGPQIPAHWVGGRHSGRQRPLLTYGKRTTRQRPRCLEQFAIGTEHLFTLITKETFLHLSQY